MSLTPDGSGQLDAGVTFDHSRALDGNAAAGAFAAALGRDVDTAEITCGTCAARSAFAQQRAYLDGPGATLRCFSCSQVIARLATTPYGTWLSLAGSVSWRLAPAT